VTTEELCIRLEEKLDGMNNNFREICERVAKHSEFIDNHINDTKDIRDKQDKFDARIAKLEKMMWFALGSGCATGFGIAKFFM
jgi:hypothetical protein